MRMPTIHPYVQIADRGTPGHSAAFREAAITDRAHDMAARMAVAISAVAHDLLTGDLLGSARDEYATSLPRTTMQEGTR
jgi:hypothetical protein